MSMEWGEPITEIDTSVMVGLDEGDYVEINVMGVKYSGPLKLQGNGDLTLGALSVKAKGYNSLLRGQVEDIAYVRKLTYPEWAKNPPRVLEVPGEGLESEIWASFRGTSTYHAAGRNGSASLRKLIATGAEPYRPVAEPAVYRAVRTRAEKYDQIVEIIKRATPEHLEHEMFADLDTNQFTIQCPGRDIIEDIKTAINF